MATVTPQLEQMERGVRLGQELVAAWWQDWRLYLRLGLERLDAGAAAAGDAPAFDDDASAEAQRLDAISKQVEQIPAERRAVFARAVERKVAEIRRLARRQQAESPVGDLAAAAATGAGFERQAIVELTAAAERGAVPTGSSWFRVDPRTVAAVPDAAAYRAARGAPRGERLQRAAAGVVMALVLACAAAALLWPRAPEAAAVPAAPGGAPALMVNDAPATPWHVAAVQLDGAAPVPLAAAGPWPPAGGGPALRPAAVAPLELCLPPGALPARLTLLGADGAPDRVYLLGASGSAAPDLRVTGCATGDLLATGALAEARHPPLLPVGQQAPALGALPPVRVLRVAVVSAATDPEIPEGMAEVRVDVVAAGGVDWLALQPTLTLESGRAITQQAIRPLHEGAAQIVHLVEVPTTPRAARWQISDPESRLAAAWRVELAPPPSRTAALASRTRLDVTEATWDAAGIVTLTLTIANRGDAPITITPADLELLQDDAPLAAPIFTDGPLALLPGTAASLTATAVADPARPVQVYLGVSGFTIGAVEGR